MTARRGSAPINLRSVTEPAPACPTGDRRDHAVQQQLVDLLDDVAAGDRAAFAEFYRATSPRVFGLALRVVRNHGAAEDIAQEVEGSWAMQPLGDLSVTLVERRLVDLG
ncbi:RNA polymerase subunit sigma, partial [Nocardia sp. NPDC060220]